MFLQYVTMQYKNDNAVEKNRVFLHNWSASYGEQSHAIVSCDHIYTVNHKNVTFYFWLKLWLILTDFYSFFYIILIVKKLYTRV